MTIDWFVLLTPLVLLPVILLFVFVGCALDTEGIAIISLKLNYGSGFDVDVKNITVTFNYTVPPKLVEGAEIGNKGFTVTTDPITLSNESLNPGGDTILWHPDELGISDMSLVTCDCVVTTSPEPSDDGVPGTPHVPSGSPITKTKDEDEDEVIFSLARLGAGFVIS